MENAPVLNESTFPKKNLFEDIVMKNLTHDNSDPERKKEKAITLHSENITSIFRNQKGILFVLSVYLLFNSKVLGGLPKRQSRF